MTDTTAQTAETGDVGTLREALGEPHCWVVPGPDTANDYGFIDAKCFQDGELSRPLWTLESIKAALAASPAPRAPAAGPAYGIIDPDYARVFTVARCIAWSEGYALVMHGSFTRDLDLLAVPWAEQATDADHLVRRIGVALDDLDLLVKDPKAPLQATEKPHGRRAWTFTFKTFGDPRFVDLSVMPRAVPTTTQKTPTAGGEGDLAPDTDAREAAEKLYNLIYAHTVIKYDPDAGIRCCQKALANRPASPEPAASAVGEGGLPKLPDGWSYVRNEAGELRVQHPLGMVGELHAALAPAAQAQPAGREEIARRVSELRAFTNKIVAGHPGLETPEQHVGWLDEGLCEIDRKLAALSTLAARPAAAGVAEKPLERVRHVKRGTEYEVLGEAKGQQLDEYGEPHPHDLVIYRKVGSKRLSWILPADFPVHFAPRPTPATAPTTQSVGGQS